MSTATLGSTTSRPRSTATTTVGWVVTLLTSAFLAFDAVIHLLNIGPVQEGSVRLGFDPSKGPLMGAVEIVCLALYLLPRTNVLGAVLLTAYLGGAFTAQLRIDAPLFSTLLFSVYVAVAVWGGLWLRDAEVRALVPVRRR